MGKSMILDLINKYFIYFKEFIAYSINKHRYKMWSPWSHIIRPLCVINKKHICIGKHVYIYKHARIEAVTSYGDLLFNPNLIIRDNVTIQQNVHITCAEYVEIGENTAIVANVTITDIIHPYSADNVHLIKCPIETKPVHIGKYCGIFSNVVILPGVRLGDHVIIGANTVVNRNIPEYCVAVGNPVRIVKRYNFESKLWEKTDKDGNFLSIKKL